MAALIALPAARLCAVEKTPDQRYLDGLIARRLFLVAESYCQRRLQRDDLDARERTELLVDLSRVHAESAINAAPESREQYWSKSHGMLEDAAAITEPSLRLLLRRQAALVHLARGRQLRQEAAVALQPQPLLDESKASLRAAVSALDELGRDVEQILIDRNRGGPLPNGALDQDELLALARDVKFQQAESLHNQGLTYPQGDRDRLNALDRAIEQFRPLAERPGSTDWDSLLGWIRSLRAAEQYEQAAALLSATEERFSLQDVSASVVMQFQLEAARLAIERDDFQRAVELLDPGPPAGAEQTAAWDFELLVALLRQWQQAEGTTAARGWQAKANDQLRLIEARHSPYWRRRAEAQLGRIVAASPQTDDAEVLVRAAQSYYRSGKIDDAIAVYQQAYEQAVRSQVDERAFEIGYTLASIEHDRRRHAAAVEKYRRLAVAHSGHARAPHAHLLAIYNAAQSLRGQTMPDSGEYETLLQEHLGRWPRSSTTDQARIWLGRLYQQRKDWERAVETLTAVRLDCEQIEEAVDRAATSYRVWIAESAGNQIDVQRLGSAAADYFEKVVLGEQNAWPAQFSQPQRAAALHSAKFRLQYAASDFDRAEKLLQVALERSPDVEASWRSAAQAWQMLAIARQPGRAAEAAALLESLADGNLPELLALLHGLDEASAQASPQAATELARLQLQVIDLVQQQAVRLTPQQVLQISRLRAAALVQIGDESAARLLYAELASELPDDGAIQTRYAELLLASDQASDWRQALIKWREVERRSQPASARWYEAKLAQAAAYEKLGNCEQAVRVVTLTRVLHKDLGGSAMKARFEALLQRCSR